MKLNIERMRELAGIPHDPAKVISEEDGNQIHVFLVPIGVYPSKSGTYPEKLHRALGEYGPDGFIRIKGAMGESSIMDVVMSAGDLSDLKRDKRFKVIAVSDTPRPSRSWIQKNVVDKVSPGSKIESVEDEPVVEQDGTESTIKALRDTDYRDKEAFFKMVQLLKGLAVASEKDEKAKKYLSAVSDALTSAAKKVLGEGEEIDESNRLGSALFSSIGKMKKELGEAEFALKHLYPRQKGDDVSAKGHAYNLGTAMNMIYTESGEWLGNKVYEIFGLK